MSPMCFIFWSPNKCVVQNGVDPIRLEHYVKTWPRLQLESIPKLTADSGFHLTDESSIDIWQGAWKTIDIKYVIEVERGRSVLIKIRPSITEALTDCPGLDDELRLQPKRQLGNKRMAEALISPLKKAHRSPSTADVTAIRDTIQPTPPSLSYSPFPLSSPTPPVPFIPRPFPLPPPATANQIGSRKYPRDWSISEYVNGWERIAEMLRTNSKLAEKDVFPVIFGTRYSKTTVWKYKRIWKNAPEDVKAKFIRLGDIQEARWGKFEDAIKAYHSGETNSVSFSDTESNIMDLDLHGPDTINFNIATPASNDLDLILCDTPTSTTDDTNLCPFCDESLKFVYPPSQALVALYEKAEKATWPAPLPYNSLHREAQTFMVTYDYCERHRFEIDDMPQAYEENWPEDIDFGQLHARTLHLRNLLDKILANISTSDFFISSKTSGTIQARFASFKGHGAG